MGTWNEMRDRIASDFVDEPVTNAQIEAAMQTAINHYARREFYFNTSFTTFPTVADQERYNASDSATIETISKFIAVQVNDGSTRTPLTPISYEHLHDAQTGILKGKPTHYAYFDQELYFYPIPDAVYTVKMSVVFKYSPISGSTTNSWTDDAEELIRQAAKVRLAIDVLQDSNLARGPAELEQVALRELMAETKRRKAPARLMTPEIVARNTFDILTGV